MEKSNCTVVKICEEIGYQIGIDPIKIYKEWTIDRVRVSYNLYTGRVYEMVRIDFAAHGIDLDETKGEGKKGNGKVSRRTSARNQEDVKDLGYKTFIDEAGKERIIPDEDRLYRFMNKLSGTGFSMR